LENEVLKNITDKVSKPFNKERWIWMVLVTGISALWVRNNINVDKLLNVYHEDILQEKQALRIKDSLLEKKNEQLVSFYKDILNLQNKINNDTSDSQRK
jgi:adenylate cyclase class IV